MESMKFQFKKQSVILILGALGLLAFLTAIIFNLSRETTSANDFLVTNVTDTSVTLVWRTDEPTSSSVLYSDGKEISYTWWDKVTNSKDLFYDDRDLTLSEDGDYKLEESRERYTHHVTIRDLDPQKEYRFKILHDGKIVNVDNEEFVTADTLDGFVAPDPVYGTVYDFDNNAIDDGVVVTYLDSGELSQALSVPLNDDGAFSLDISTARNAELTGAFDRNGDYKDLLFVWTKYGEIMRRIDKEYDQPIGQPGRDGDILKYNESAKALFEKSSEGTISKLLSLGSSEVNASGVSGSCAAGDTDSGTYGECCSSGKAREVRRCTDSSSGVFYYKFSECVHDAPNCSTQPAPDQACNNNGVRDCQGYTGGNCESGVDCGNSVCGSCASMPEENCGVPQHCENGTKDNGLEEGVDCGGACPSCGGPSQAAQNSDATPVGEAGCGTPAKPPCPDHPNPEPPYIPPGPPEQPDDPVDPPTTGICCKVTKGERTGQLVWTPGISNCLQFSRESTRYEEATNANQCTGYIDPPQNPVCADGLNETSPGEIEGGSSGAAAAGCTLANSPNNANDLFCCPDTPPTQPSCPADKPIEKLPSEIPNVQASGCVLQTVRSDNNIVYCCPNEGTPTCEEEGYTPANKATRDFGERYGTAHCYTSENTGSNYGYCCKPTPKPEQGPLCGDNYVEVSPTQQGSYNDCYQVSNDNYCCYSPTAIEIPIYPSNTQNNSGFRFVQTSYAAEGVQESVEPGGYEVTVGDPNFRASTQFLEVTESSEVYLFYDDNGNGIRDGIEQYLSDADQQALSITIQKVTDIMEYNLDYGWNFIAIPMIMNDDKTSQVSDAKGLLTKFNEDGATVTHVAAYREGKFLVYSQRVNQDGSTAEYGDNFQILPGEGYIVKNLTRVDSALTGYLVDGDLPININPGWNLVNIYNSSKEYTAFGALREMQLQTIEANTLSKFESGRYQSSILDQGNEYGFDFPLFPNSAYFVRNRSEDLKTFRP